MNKHILISTLLLTSVACSAQVHLSGSDAESKMVATGNSGSSAEANSQSKGPIVSEPQKAPAPVVAQSQPQPQPVAQQQPVADYNPYAVQAKESREIAGSFLTFECAFNSGALECKLFDTSEPEKIQIKRPFKATLAGVNGDKKINVESPGNADFVAIFTPQQLGFQSSDCFDATKFQLTPDVVIENAKYSPKLIADEFLNTFCMILDVQKGWTFGGSTTHILNPAAKAVLKSVRLVNVVNYLNRSNASLPSSITVNVFDGFDGACVQPFSIQAGGAAAEIKNKCQPGLVARQITFGGVSAPSGAVISANVIYTIETREKNIEKVNPAGCAVSVSPTVCPFIN